MNPNLFTATAKLNSEQYLLCEIQFAEDDVRYQIIGDIDEYWYESDFQDLTPVTVVPKDGGVWIEGVTAQEIKSARDFIASTYWADGSATRSRNKSLAILDAILAQLTPSATTESEGGEREARCKDCGGIKYDENGRWCESDFHLPSKPTPTVTIELTEYDRINVDTAMKTMELPAPLAEIIAKIYNAMQPLTPPRPEEPMLGTIGLWKSRQHAVQRKVVDRDYQHLGEWFIAGSTTQMTWQRICDDFQLIWSPDDLINPVILSEGITK